MGERKVLNKYYPPDFDPSKLVRAKGAKNAQFNVRMMCPMTVQCNTCGEYIYAGKKFNCRKEVCHNETYLGIKLQRFYYKCPMCSSEFTLKTDPKNADYQCEFGVTRLFESFEHFRDKEWEEEEKKKEDEEDDAMLALENRTKESKREMDVLDTLAAIRDANARHSRISAEDLLAKFYEEKEKKLAEAVAEREREGELLAGSGPDGEMDEARRVFASSVRRIEGEGEGDGEGERVQPQSQHQHQHQPGPSLLDAALESASATASASASASSVSGLGGVRVVVKPKSKKKTKKKDKDKGKGKRTRDGNGDEDGGGSGEKRGKGEAVATLGLGGYGSDSGSDSD